MSMEILRKKIDGIDEQIVALLEARLHVAAEMADFKKQVGLPIADRRREMDKLSQLSSKVPPELSQYVHSLYEMIFEQSRAHQSSILHIHSPLYQDIQAAITDTTPLFPPSASVACQGVEGAYSQLATERLFPRPSVSYFKTFESVFSAIANGFCRYGVLPLENSTAGSVNKIYDLMMQYDFKIVRSLRLKVDHSLLALPGVKKEEIREIISHEQAISQCAGFLESLGSSVKITCVENTAAAAEAVKATNRPEVAAIASHSCAKLYQLDCIESDIQDRSNNYTRFICIAKNLEIYPGADRTSIMLVLPHKPGSLHRVLSRFAALGINLNKLESRPIPERDFEFMFYFDLETSVYSEEFATLMDSMRELCEDFRYLGSYIEVI